MSAAVWLPASHPRLPAYVRTISKAFLHLTCPCAPPSLWIAPFCLLPLNIEGHSLPASQAKPVVSQLTTCLDVPASVSQQIASQYCQKARKFWRPRCPSSPSPTRAPTQRHADLYITMVSRAYYPPPPPHPHDGARYLPSRSCAPYYSYPERRYQLPSHDARSMTMTDPQTDETTPPRKRIAVAVSSDPFSFSYNPWHQSG